MQNSRNMVLYTAKAGADRISHLISVHYCVEVVNYMLEEERISTEEATNLKSMLNSEDKDNYEIAIMAINHIK